MRAVLLLLVAHHDTRRAVVTQQHNCTQCVVWSSVCLFVWCRCGWNPTICGVLCLLDRVGMAAIDRKLKLQRLCWGGVSRHTARRATVLPASEGLLSSLTSGRTLLLPGCVVWVRHVAGVLCCWDLLAVLVALR